MSKSRINPPSSGFPNNSSLSFPIAGAGRVGELLQLPEGSKWLNCP